MVKVKVIGCPTFDALAAVSLPDFEFNRGRYDSARLGLRRNRLKKIFFPFYSDEFELENVSSVGLFNPRINKVKDAVIRPDALFDFFIYSNPLRRLLTCLEILCSSAKFSVFRKLPRRAEFGLVSIFGIWVYFRSREVMAFVNHGRAIIFEAVAIRRIWADRHKDN